MKLFSWAHRKLPHNLSLEKKTVINAEGFFEAPKASDEDLQASTNKETPDIEILTIGTLGMGNLLNMHAKDDDGDDAEDDHTHDDEEEKHELAPNVSPNRASASPNRALASPNRESASPNRESVSSNRESVSSVDMQKLQEELQKILYFKLGGPCKSEKSTTREGSRRKKDNNNSNTNYNDSSKSNDGRSHVQGERGGAFPLHNFLEMPMDALPPPAAPLMHKKQWSLQSFRRKFLHHFSSATRVRVSPSLFEKLMKPKASLHHHGSKAEKLFQLLRRMSASHKRRKNYEGSEENEDDDRLKLALSRSRGSERFIDYVSKVADFADHQNQLIIHCTSSTLAADREGQVQIMLNSPSANECWIKTDDEYLVLEL